MRALNKRMIEGKPPGRPEDRTLADESLDLEIVDSRILDTSNRETYEATSATSNSGASSTDASSARERKSPTVTERGDMTVELPSSADSTSAARGDQNGTSSAKPTRRSTRSPMSDKTIDLAISPSDAEHISMQWDGVVDARSRPGQTLRQKETVTGYRSSLQVKSRYLRSRDTGAQRLTHHAPGEVPDYELLDIIGEGGMGVVYAAHQSSIARTVAVKMLKPSSKVGEQQRDKFISEAVVTGELDHPNIVPIYDLGANDEGALFYSMKRVRGTPWDKVIDKKSLDENVNILLRVADAVAFAHAGGVIHRDLKPENVMLGDYGEVLVMDWGLARITPEFAHADAVYQADSLGGTPAYMAPEMARGPVDTINKTSDIYLLGAILYEIIGGHPPHSGRDVMQCIMAASQNKIDAIRYEGELKDIALKAMSTAQSDRYQTVKEFQEAVRRYQSHSESLVLTAHANQNLQKARTSGDYALYARALYGFQESLTLWDANHRARKLLAETQSDYARCALEKGDLDLAASLLQSENADQQPLLDEIEAARTERDARARRLRLAKRAVAALVATVLATITIAFFNVRAARNVAVVERDKADVARGVAEAAQKEEKQARNFAELKRQEAEEAKALEAAARKLAEEQEQIARDEEAKAREQEALAKAAKEAEAYEAYIAQIGLAAAKIDENAYDFAAKLLEECEPARRNWEWGRLAQLCQLSSGAYDAQGPVDAVAYSPDGLTFVSGDWAGKITLRDVQSGTVRWQVPHGQYVTSVAFSPNGEQIAAASSDGTIKIVGARDGSELKTLQGHTDGVLSVRFSPDGNQLASGSYDQTARIWDLKSGETVQTLQGHSWWVWAAEFSPGSQRLVTAGQDGKAIVWERRGTESDERNAPDAEPGANRAAGADQAGSQFHKLTEFTGHDGAVYSAKFSPDGTRIATGGYDTFVMVWNPDDVEPVDIQSRVDGSRVPAAGFLKLSGHTGPVRSVAFSPNGELILSGAEDNSLRLWDASSGTPLKSLRGHGSAIRSCAFSPDGKWVLSGSKDERIRLWNIDGYQEVRVLHATTLSGHEDVVLGARFSADGRQVVTASRDRSAILWDSATGKQLRKFVEGHEFLASSAVFFNDGKRLATGAGDNSVRIWDLESGTQISALSPTGRNGALAVSPDGDWIVTGSPGRSATLWDSHSGQAMATLGGHDAEVSSIAFAPGGERIITGDDRGRLRVWVRGSTPAVGASSDSRSDASPWKFERELVGHNGGITGIRITPDGRRAVTSSGDRSCGQWNLETGEEFRQLVLKHGDWVSSLDVSSDGKFALTTCDDGQARIWRLDDATEIASLPSTGKMFNAARFAPDGSSAVLTSTADRLVQIWNWKAEQREQDELNANLAGRSGDSLALDPSPLADVGHSAKVFLDFNKLGGLVWSALFAPDGDRILTLGGNDAQLWDVESQQLVTRFSPHGAVASTDISPDGRLVATGSWDHSAKIWNADTGQALLKLEGGHQGYINSVEFSPDGRELLTASDDGTARLWDVATGKASDIVFRGHTGRLLGATFSPNGAHVLTVGSDKTARLWDRATGQEQRQFIGHAWGLLSGAFSPDGLRIITGSQDNTAKVWDVATGKELITLGGHTAPVSAVAFAPDGLRVLTGSQDNTAKLWDPATGKEILSLPGHKQEVTSVSFSPDGRSVLTSSRDGKAIIWTAVDWRGNAPAPAEIERQARTGN